MRDELSEARLAALEREMGQRLRSLPAVRPGAALEERVMGVVRSERLAAGKVGASGRQWAGWARFGSRSIVKVAAAAAAVALVAGLGVHFLGPSRDLGGIGLLLAPSAQAASFQASDLSFRLGSSSLRDVDFEIGAALPEIGKTGVVAVYRRPALTSADALSLAASLGIKGAQLLSAPGDRVAVAGTSDVSVWLDLEVGSWYYTDISRPNENSAGGSGAASSGSDAARNLAEQWLATAGKLPRTGYTATVAGDETAPGSYLVTVRPESGPDGLPIVGGSPSLWVRLGGGRVVDAGGTWYEENDRLEADLVSLEDAIDALRRGEGEFLAHGSGGTAVIKKAELGYQLAYGLDFVPYLVPVAVFSGDYRAEGQPVEPFQAYVSVLRYEGGPNPGNFTLDTKLPAGGLTAPSLGERAIAVSEAELPALAQFFGAAIAANGGVDGGNGAGGEIATTSWDGGWLWRGRWTASGVTVAQPMARDAVLAIATELARKLPVLPGRLGTPKILVDDPGFAWVSFPLLYDGIGVLALDPTSTSALNVQVHKPDGAVIAVNCVRPMTVGESRPVISAEQAWDKLLLAGEAQVTLGGYLENVPASRFSALVSKVTGVTLAAIPEHPELSRNAVYHLAYAFSGEARVGDHTIAFTALVAAEPK